MQTRVRVCQNSHTALISRDFECLTMRDWDEAVCGIRPIFESADGNCKNCSPINNQKVV